MTTRAEIWRWLEEAKRAGATHMIVVCDMYDHDDYPVNVMPGQDVREREKEFDSKNMQKVVEVYSLSRDLDEQLAEERAFHYD